MFIQIYLNKFLSLHNDELNITHNGKAGMKHVDINELKEWIHRDSPDIIKGNKIQLIKLPINQLLYMDMESMNNFIINSIKYCKIRDRYKKYLSQKRKNEKLKH